METCRQTFSIETAPMHQSKSGNSSRSPLSNVSKGFAGGRHRH